MFLFWTGDYLGAFAGMNILMVISAGFMAPILLVLSSMLRRSAYKRMEDVRTALVFAVCGFLGGAAQLLLIHYLHHTVDTRLLAADHMLGIDTLYWWRFAVEHNVLWTTLACVYALMPTVIAVTWILEQNSTLRTVCVLGTALAFVGYMLLPAVGPCRFDWATQTPPATMRNCLPSMHVTWSLLLVVFARNRWLKAGLACFSVLTMLSTIGLGEHYVVDIIAAFPFTALLCSFTLLSNAQGAAAQPVRIFRLLTTSWTE